MGLEATSGAEFEARSQLMYWKPVLIKGVVSGGYCGVAAGAVALGVRPSG